MTRIVLYCADVVILTGKSESSSRRLMNQIKAYFNRKPHNHLTITDFCEFLGVSPETVWEKLKN